MAAGLTVGVAKNALLFSVKSLNCAGAGSRSQIVSGINFVTSATTNTINTTYVPLNNSPNRMLFTFCQ